MGATTDDATMRDFSIEKQRVQRLGLNPTNVRCGMRETHPKNVGKLSRLSTLIVSWRVH